MNQIFALTPALSLRKPFELIALKSLQSYRTDIKHPNLNSIWHLNPASLCQTALGISDQQEAVTFVLVCIAHKKIACTHFPALESFYFTRKFFFCTCLICLRIAPVAGKASKCFFAAYQSYCSWASFKMNFLLRRNLRRWWLRNFSWAKNIPSIC